MSELKVPPILPYAPKTHLERGVAVPFTTPLLFGSRARPGQRLGGIELVLPNPTGGRGVYVLPMDAAGEFCRPTLHDRQLIKGFDTLPAFTPRSVRGLARDIAARGVAGEDAMDAAAASAKASHRNLLVANYRLVMILVETVEGTRNATPEALSAPDMEQRAQRAVARVAPRLGQPQERVADALEALAGVYCNLDMASEPGDAWVGRTINRLQDLRTGIAAWTTANQDDELCQCAAMLCDIAETTADLAARLAAQALALADNPVELLRGWTRDPGAIERLVDRPEWLLDGWDQICLLWDLAKHPAARRTALVEIAQLVPVSPREASDWAGSVLDNEKQNLVRRIVPQKQDWRTGATIDLVMRNEHLRAGGV